MILMPQIFDVIANENARYKRNELESCFSSFKVLADHSNIFPEVKGSCDVTTRSLCGWNMIKQTACTDEKCCYDDKSYTCYLPTG